MTVFPGRVCEIATRAFSTALLMTSIFGFVATSPGRAADAGPTLLKRTLNITTHRFLRYWKTPTAKEPVYNTWCWIPRMNFQVLGAIPAGSKFTVEFGKPDGSKWIYYTCDTPEAGDDALTDIKTPEEDESVAEKKAILTTGTFPFKIKLVNQLAGTNTVLISSKYRVKTFTPAGNIPEYKNKAEFYVLQDWRLPIGFLSLDPAIDDKAPQLMLQFWCRGPNESAKMGAYLFSEGKLISKVESGEHNDLVLDTGVGDAAYRWSRWGFGFPRVRGYNQNTDSANNTDALYFLDKHPGDYEIKVMENGFVVRSAKFTVGADGKIVDNGIATKNHLGGARMVIPVKVLGTADHNWNPTEWSTDAFYGNPLIGFTAP